GKDAIAAAFTVWEGLNPASVLLAPARSEGVTTVLVVPSGGLISGQAAVVDLVNGSLSDMMVRAPAGMIAEIGDKGSAGVGARAELLVKLKELLEDTRAYGARKDRKSTRLNSSHVAISYAVFCLKKKKK